jgi:hypothetical protein
VKLIRRSGGVESLEKWGVISSLGGALQYFNPRQKHGSSTEGT